MKQRVFWTITSIIIGFLGMTVLAPSLIAQKNFNMDEKRLVERYKQATPFYLDGVKQFNNGNLDKAEKKFLETLEILPEHSDAAYMLAKLQLQRKEFSTALISIITAEKNYSFIAKFKTFTHQQYLDSLRQQQQGLDDQLNTLQGALADLPQNFENDSERAAIEKDIASVNRTKQTLESRLTTPISSIDEIPADYFFIHGNALYKLGMLGDAATQFQKAINLDPNHGNAYNNLALVSFSLGKFQEALDWLVRAEAAGVKINPDFKKAIETKIPPK